MSEAWVWQYIPGETPRVSNKCHNFNLTYLVHFNVLFYLWLLEARSRQFCNLCSHKLNGCHWNNHHYWGLKPFPVGGSWVQLRRCWMRFGFTFFKKKKNPSSKNKVILKWVRLKILLKRGWGWQRGKMRKSTSVTIKYIERKVRRDDHLASEI